MPYNTEQLINTGAFVPTTNIWDVARLNEIDVSSPEFKELLVRLYQNINLMANVLNIKDSGYYVESEFATSQQLFNPASNDPLQQRSIFRKVINIGALNAGVTSVVHGLAITNTWKFLKIYGAANNTATLTYVPLPYPGIAGNIQVQISSTHVVLNNASGLTFNVGYIILEYTKI